MIKKILCTKNFLIISIIHFELYLCSILSSGIFQFNNFLYLHRLNAYIKQNITSQCSMNMGPHCFYTESDFISSQKSKNISPDWLDMFSQLKEFSLEEIYQSTENTVANYLYRNINQKDNRQSAPILEYEIGITFEKYDSITIKKDIYLDQRTIITVGNEKIPFIVEGKMRLKYDKLKIIVQNMMDFPSKTYGIIESRMLTISLDGKYFLCRSFFIRPHNKYNEDNENRVTFIGQSRLRVTIEGYNKNRLVFSTYFEFAYIDEKHWNKVTLPKGEAINKLVIPGGYEVDNFAFLLKGNYLYDIQTHYYNNPKQKTLTLITDDDI